MEKPYLVHVLTGVYRATMKTDVTKMLKKLIGEVGSPVKYSGAIEKYTKNFEHALFFVWDDAIDELRFGVQKVLNSGKGA